MSGRDLILSACGSMFLKYQRRLYVALHEYSQCQGLTTYFSTPRASMNVVPGLASGELLAHIAWTCGAQTVERPTHFAMARSLNEQSSIRIAQYCEWAVEQGAAPGPPPKPEDLFDTASLPAMMKFLCTSFNFLLTHREIGIQTLPAEADKLPQKEEIKAAIDLLGENLLTIPDINDDFETDPSMFTTGAWIIYLSTFLALQGMVAILVSLPVRVRYIVGLTRYPSLNANMLAIFNIVQLFASPIWNRVSDTIGRKRIMVFIYAVYAVCYIMMSLSSSITKFEGDDEYYWLAAWRGLSGAAAMIAPVGNTILNDLCPLKQRTHSIAMLNGSAMLGGATGPLVAMFLKGKNPGGLGTDDIGFSAYFTACCRFGCISMVVTSVFVALVLPETAPLKRAREVISGVARNKSTAEKKTQADSFFKTLGQVVRNRSLLFLIISYFLTLGGMCLVKDMNGPIVQNTLLRNPDVISMAATVRSFASFFFCFFLIPHFNRWFGERVLTYFGHLCLIVAYVSLIIVIDHTGETAASDKDVYLYYFASGIAGLSDGFAHASYLSMCSLFATPRNRGSILGIAQIGNSVGRSIPTIIMGMLYGETKESATKAFQIAFLYPVLAFVLTITSKPTLQRSDITKLSDAKELESMDVAGHVVKTDSMRAIEVTV